MSEYECDVDEKNAWVLLPVHIHNKTESMCMDGGVANMHDWPHFKTPSVNTNLIYCSTQPAVPLALFPPSSLGQFSLLPIHPIFSLLPC